MNTLVTGCAGFIGSNVARLLLELGYSVQGVDNLCDPNVAQLKQSRLNALIDGPRFTFHRTDVSDHRGLHPIFRGDNPDGPVFAVIHLAASAGVRDSVENPRPYYETNVLGTLNLLELCREFSVSRFILASTSSVYGSQMTGPVTEDAPCNRPLSPYAASKTAAETLLHSYHHIHGLNATVVRYFTVYGPAAPT